MFWTLGGNQVRCAAISGWQEVLAPAAGDQDIHLKVWPGDLSQLCAPGATVVVETYPAEFYDISVSAFRRRERASDRGTG